MSFDDFLFKFGKSYGPAEYKERRKLFHSSLEKIHSHNNDANKSFHLGINKFADLTEAEIATYHGFHFDGWRRTVATKKRASLPDSAKSGNEIPDSWDWRDYDKVSPVKDQGGCGSCWAFSGVGAIESNLLMNNFTLTSLSEQQYVDCVPNPDECGGTGGCNGATQPLLFEYAVSNGSKLEADYTYTAKTGTSCEADEYATVATIADYQIVPENCEVSTLQAFMLEMGPIAVSVDASSWSHYAGGVLDYDSCGADINHAVLLVGYGTDAEYGDYWTIKNSWGESWGEDGFIRISRDDGTAVDSRPSDGTGCADGPDEVEVRGTCGVLYANSFPLGAQLVAAADEKKKQPTTTTTAEHVGSDTELDAAAAAEEAASTKAALFKAIKAPRGIVGGALGKPLNGLRGN